MPHVLICFTDGEVLHAETPEISFDIAVLEAEIRGVDANAERALFALAAIRQILVGDPAPAPEAHELDTWDRAAFHFSDGEVLRAFVAPEALLGRHGGVWRIVQPGSAELVTIAVPYAALKGVFRIRQWDSRSLAEREAGDEAALDQLARVLAERDAGTAAVPQRRALLARMRSSHGPDARP